MITVAIQSSSETFACAIVGHLVGDYLLQNDWMALNKKLRAWPCVVHCFLWGLAVCVFAGWTLLPFVILFMLHFAQDRTNVIRLWMTRINRQPKFVEPPMAPWSIIVVDNVWHIVTIWAVWKLHL